MYQMTWSCLVSWCYRSRRLVSTPTKVMIGCIHVSDSMIPVAFCQKWVCKSMCDMEYMLKPLSNIGQWGCWAIPVCVLKDASVWLVARILAAFCQELTGRKPMLEQMDRSKERKTIEWRWPTLYFLWFFRWEENNYS